MCVQHFRIPVCLFLISMAFHAAAKETTTEATLRTALDDYVAKQDDSYSWNIASRKETDGGTLIIVDMQSQTWRSPDEVDKVDWRHWLKIFVPSEVRYKKALLMIDGGDNSAEIPNDIDSRLIDLATKSNSIVVDLPTVPNQPLIFFGDGVQRTEDAILAYSWEQFLKTQDPTWIAQLPMAKSVVRAMDTVQAVLQQSDPPREIEQFVVTGGSKRGWTTWLTAAVDSRVCAIAPLVIDMLNITESMPHHHQAYGEWAPTLDDYVEHQLPDHLDDPEYRQLVMIVDPYTYRSRLTLPKFIINSSGDEFFVPDSSQFYYDDLVGEKHLCYVPNTGHSLKDSTAVETLSAFYLCVLAGVPVPTLHWEQTEANQWVIHTSAKPQEVLLWTAHNPAARDFRVQTVGPAYISQAMQSTTRGDYLVELPQVDSGWTATFAEFRFQEKNQPALRMTSPVWITPDTYPQTAAVAKSEKSKVDTSASP